MVALQAQSSVQMGTLLPRERQRHEYQQALVERYKHLPEVKRISRHRHLPTPIYKVRSSYRYTRLDHLFLEAVRCGSKGCHRFNSTIKVIRSEQLSNAL